MFPVEEESKRPLYGFRRGWQQGEPKPWERIKPYAEAGHPIALEPWSITTGDKHLVGLDWDAGSLAEAADFVVEHPPYIIVPSNQEGRFHLYYLSDVQRGNGLWYWRGQARGHIKSKGGYLVMWKDAVTILDKYLSEPELGVQMMFPESVLQAAGDDLAVLHSPAPDYAPTGVISPHRDTRTPMLDGSVDWSRIVPTVRNQSVFDALRFYAYKAPADEFSDYEAWREALAEIARSMAAGIPDRGPSGSRGSARRHFTDDEVEGIVSSVAWYVWNRCGVKDVGRADSATQARRARRGVEKRRWDKRERDAEIMRMTALGAKRVDIAAALGVDRNTVARAIKRKLAQEAKAAGKSEQISPRDEGILMHKRMGWKIEDIAEVFNISPRTVNRVLKKRQNATLANHALRGDMGTSQGEPEGRL